MSGAKYVEAVLLGIVQGIAEFLPISSSGHLVILQQPLQEWLGTRQGAEDDLQMNVALHLGTLLSILVVYRRDIVGLFSRPRLCLAIVVASIPAGILGLTLKDWFEQVFQTPLIAGCCLLVTAALLALGQRLERNELALEDVSPGIAFAIGLFQAVALLPGVSRSGSTIAGGLMCGLRRDAAAAFSFLIAIPAIGGAGLIEAREMWQGTGGGHHPSVLLAGAAVSFVVGVLVLRWLIAIVTQRRLHWFAWYCAAAGVATIVWQLSLR